MITPDEAREMTRTARAKLEEQAKEVSKQTHDLYLKLVEESIIEATAKGLSYFRIGYIPDSVIDLLRKLGYTIEISPVRESWQINCNNTRYLVAW